MHDFKLVSCFKSSNNLRSVVQQTKGGHFPKMYLQARMQLFVFVYQCGKPSALNSQTTVEECGAGAGSGAALSDPT